MGAHIRAVCQRRVNGTWRHMLDIPCSPVRVEWLNKVHYRFMLYDGCEMVDGSIEWNEEDDAFAIARNRGYPEDFDSTQWESVEFFDPVLGDNVRDVDLPWDEGCASWLSIDELVNHDYERIITYWGVAGSIRSFLGDAFIQFWKDAQAAGAERVVFSIG